MAAASLQTMCSSKSIDFKRSVSTQFAVERSGSTTESRSELWGDISPKLLGLVNSGTNTCYLNSVLQVLSFTPEVYKYVVNSNHRNHCDKFDFCALCGLADHMLTLAKSNQKTLEPTDFIQNISAISSDFRIPQQQDALECLTSLVEKVSKAGNGDFITKFQFDVCNTITCTGCGHTKQKMEQHNTLWLNPAVDRNSSLEWALNEFAATEVLDGVDCDSCKQRTGVSIQASIHTQPDVLAVQLNRFANGLGVKNNQYVSYPDKLDISPFITSGSEQEESVYYNLHGVVVHSGAYSSSGHYIAFVKSPEGMWFRMNDTKVTEVSEKTALKQPGAYICIYQKEKIEKQSFIHKCSFSNHNVYDQVLSMLDHQYCDQQQTVKESYTEVQNTELCDEEVNFFMNTKYSSTFAQNVFNPTANHSPKRKRETDFEEKPLQKRVKIDTKPEAPQTRKIIKRSYSDLISDEFRKYNFYVDSNHNYEDTSSKRWKVSETTHFVPIQRKRTPVAKVRYAPLLRGSGGYFVYTNSTKMIIRRV